MYLPGWPPEPTASSVDALNATNVNVLIPGGWTYPALDVGYVTLALTEGATVQDVNFGWDYQFLP
jgi:hypothetical protein